MGRRPSRSRSVFHAFVLLIGAMVWGPEFAADLKFGSLSAQEPQRSGAENEKKTDDFGRRLSELRRLADEVRPSPTPGPDGEGEDKSTPDPIQEAVDEEIDELAQLNHFTRVTNRWYRNPWSLLPQPAYEINEPGDKIWDPYRQNVLKGDFPIIGEDLFFRFTLTERAVVEGRSLPTPAVLTSPSINSPAFFGKDDQFFFQSNTVFSFDLFKGQEAFKPVDWRIRLSPVFNYTLLAVSEVGNVAANIGDDRTRITGDFSLQEALVEIHLFDLNTRYDFLSSEFGILPFRSDFRGFIFDDVNLGARFFATADDNKWQFNLVGFHMLEKDFNSDLNTFEERDQQVFIFNVYRFDFLTKGYNINFSYHFNGDNPSTYFNENNFLIRPAPVGLAREKNINAHYLGFAGDGHIGRFNVTHAFYHVFGKETNNNFAARDVDINAQFAALEVSYDFDWFRFRIYAMYASGDDDPLDDKGEGFDAIVDFPNFAGGENTFLMRQQLQLLGVGLSTRFSFLTDLTSSRFQGQANYVNPGLIILGTAVNYDITPTLRGQTGFNYYEFDHTEVLEQYLFLEDISTELGSEIYSSLQWRPLLTNNIIVNIGAAVFFPGDAYEKIFQTDDVEYSVFLDLIVTY